MTVSPWAGQVLADLGVGVGHPAASSVLRRGNIRSRKPRQCFPLAGRSKAVEIDERDAAQHGVADLDDTAKSRQSFLIDLFVCEKFRVVQKVPQEPTQLPHRFLCAVQTADDGLAC